MKKLFSIIIVLTIVFLAFVYLKFDNRLIKKTPSPQNTGIMPQTVIKTAKEGIGRGKYIEGHVVKVVDGDTIDVKYKDKVYRVRLLYIDTPESVKQGVAVQKYAKEAQSYISELVMDRDVRVVFENDLEDKYRRLLANIVLEDGSFVNELLVKNGLARVEVASPNRGLADYFYKLQEKAIDKKVGLWGLPREDQPFVRNDKGLYVPK